MHRQTQSHLVAVLVATLIGATSRPALAAWDGTQQIVPGDRVSAAFVSSPGTETHYFPFYAPDGTRLTVSWKGPRGLILDVQVLDPDLQPLAVASHTKRGRIRRLPLPTRGRHTMQLKTTSGAGRYRLKTSAAYARSYGGKSLTTPASNDFEIDLGAPAGTRLNARVKKAKGSTAAPTFASLAGPRGNVDLGEANPTAIKRLRLDATGLFRLAVAGGAGGNINLKVAPAFPVGRTDYRFDEASVTPGSAEAIRTAWLGSAHADLTAEPFAHWNDEVPALVPRDCSKCHSGLGYRDFLGALANPNATPPETSPSANLNDPAPAPGRGQVASGPWPVGTPVNCDTCHNGVTQSLSEITFPSGLTVTGLGDESRCMVCHQGRESTVSVEKQISNAYGAATDPITSDDTVSSALSFINVHYFAAAGSLFGREAKVAYEYADPSLASEPIDPVTGLSVRMPYDAKFAHVASKDVCFECHDQHSLKVRVTECATCHVNRNGDPIVTTAPMTETEYRAAIDNLHDVRMAGTINDFDGDGDAREGVYYELAGLRDTLYAAIRAYANTPKTSAAGAAVPATPVAYSPTTYPYFFLDPNDNGTVDAGETTRYNAWTARLLRAAYDYQYAQKDPGTFAHNAKYLIEVLHDAIADVNAVQAVPGFAQLIRNDSGHFDTSAEAYRRWDEDTDHLVDPSCARCHSVEGFLFRAKYGVDQTIPATLSSGMTCESCHESGANFSPMNGNTPARRYIRTVKFPHPATATSQQIAAITITNGDDETAAEDDSFTCMTCHQGRESTLTVNAANPSAETRFVLSFRNVHYLPAGATLYGSQAAGAYQYAGKMYSARSNHDPTYTDTATNPRARCSYCHMQDGSHSFEVKLVTACVECHTNTQSVDEIRPAFRPEDNWDGDPMTKPKEEIAVFAARLYAAIQAYCKDKTDTATPSASYTAYNGAAYPYWFKDTNQNGLVDANETTAMRFDSAALRAAFNYQYYQKEPGAWAHNNRYFAQILYDAIEALGGDLTNLTRPPL